MRSPTREPVVESAARQMREMAREGQMPYVTEGSRERAILAEQTATESRVIQESFPSDCVKALEEREVPPVDTSKLAIEASAVISTYRVTQERYDRAAAQYSRMGAQQRENARPWITEIRATHQAARDEYQAFMKALIKDAASWRAQLERNSVQ